MTVDARASLRPDEATPLGATPVSGGTSFALFSQHATAVQLCLFDDEGRTETARIGLQPSERFVWRAFVEGVGPGQRYGYRVDGRYFPEAGHRFNASKLLVDPYARAITGVVDWNGPVYGYRPGRRRADSAADRRDDAVFVPKGVVVDSNYDWGDERSPRVSWSRIVIYELHLKGFTATHPRIPEALRGTYAGLGHPAAIEHLVRLGVTAVELLPVHAFVDDDFLVQRGLRNYWGYSTLGFFAPEGRYSSVGDGGGQVDEFKGMVKALHAAGIEVLLDVVYNHTCEGNHLGPTLSFRGLDNAVYYRLFHGQPRFYDDVTGTGNTVDVAHPQVLKLVMDSLRYWVQEMRVDGFRFDLAPALAREESSYHRTAAFFRAVHQDPVLSTVKLIAEPWDIGLGGYQLGHFPPGWAEWNDRYRDTVRRFWRGDRGTLGELGFRLTGSADLYQAARRGPLASVNFVTAHDGFTLRDLVSYERKHNLANGELNRDGSDHNLSSNYGMEGPVTDERIATVRDRQIRNMIATLLLSQGVPMVCGGDELGRTQGGNNNAYCQDNEVSWLDWSLLESEGGLAAFAEAAIRLRASMPNLRRSSFLHGQRVAPGGPADITWYKPDGRLMRRADWDDGERRSFGFRLAGVSDGPADDGAAVASTVFVAMNAEHRAVRFRLPPGLIRDADWHSVLSTDPSLQDGTAVRSGASLQLMDRSLAVFASIHAPAAPAHPEES